MADEKMQELMAGLTDALSKVLTPPESASTEGPSIEERLTKMETSIEAVSKNIETLTAMLAPGDDKGEGRGSITKAIGEIADTVGAHHEVLERILDRSATKTSVDGDDHSIEDDKTEVLKFDGKTPVIKSGLFDGMIRAALAGRKVELTG